MQGASEMGSDFSSTWTHGRQADWICFSVLWIGTASKPSKRLVSAERCNAVRSRKLGRQVRMLRSMLHCCDSHDDFELWHEQPIFISQDSEFEVGHGKHSSRWSYTGPEITIWDVLLSLITRSTVVSRAYSLESEHRTLVANTDAHAVGTQFT